MVDVGGRDVDGLKKSGHKIKTVSCSVKELFISCNLSDHIDQHQVMFGRK